MNILQQVWDAFENIAHIRSAKVIEHVLNVFPNMFEYFSFYSYSSLRPTAHNALNQLLSLFIECIMFAVGV